MSTYQSGTISVTSGTTTVTSVDTVFRSQAFEGDLFICGGITAIIAAVPSNNELTLASPWSGSTLNDEADYMIVHTSNEWHSTVTVNEQLANLLERISTGLGQIIAVVPDKKGTVSSGTVIFDAAANSRFTITVAGAQTWSVLWPNDRFSEIEIMASNAGSATITLPTGIRWLKGDGTYNTSFASQGVTLQATGVNTFILWTPDGGVTVYGRAG